MLKLDAPRDGDIHTIADFAEILCLLTPDRYCSRDYLSDYIRDTSGKSLDDADIEDTFAQFSWRAQAFGEHYPFVLDAHGRVFSAGEQLTDAQQIYAFLLLCANLPFVKQKDRQSLTDSFERAALCALRRLWPTLGSTRSFGKNETNYTGAKWERLNALGHDIGGRPQLSATTYRKQDSGDGGVDLVAWLDLDAHEKWNIPSALAQCACSREEWPKKQNEISFYRLGRHLAPSHPWMEMIFIPHSFRNNQGRWAVDGEIGSPIVMDRLRLINYIDTNVDWPIIAPPEVFTSFLDERLELV